MTRRRATGALLGALLLGCTTTPSSHTPFPFDGRYVTEEGRFTPAYREALGATFPEVRASGECVPAVGATAEEHELGLQRCFVFRRLDGLEGHAYADQRSSP